jgi:hypothetical protein
MTPRQYCDSATINNITGTTGVTYDDALIAVAEADIDAFCQDCMDLLNRNNLKSVMDDSEFDSSEISVGTLSLTLPVGNYSLNQYQNTVVELLKDSGMLKRGQRIPVVSSVNNVLTLGATIPTAIPVIISQVGVFPRQIDDGKYGKSIPYEIVEAVAWQVAHLKSLSADLAKSVKANSKKAGIKSESIGSSYSYTLGSGKTDPTDAVCIKSQALISSLF